MKFKLSGNVLTVTREETDRKYYGTQNGAGESNFLYDLKNELNKLGFDLIKKRMWKDGHLMDDIQQYLRARNKASKAPHIYLYSNFWAIRGLNDDFNNGEVDIAINYDVFNCQPDCEELTKKMLNGIHNRKQNNPIA